jgi:hypothetical protein
VTPTRVFLTATSPDESTLVREVLFDLGAEVLDARTVVLGTRWSERLARWWNDVDAAVAVLTGSRGGRENVVFELGIALGRGLPLLVLQGDEPAQLPLELTEVLSARTNLQNAEALRFHLELFLDRLSSGTAIKPPPPEPHRVDVGELRRSLDELRRSSKPRGQDYEQWVARLFRLAGADVVEPRDPEDRGFDLAVALPGVSPEPGPLFVEVKVPAQPLDLAGATSRLHELVLRERAGLGLLLFEDRRLRYGFGFQTTPMVVAMGFDELLFSLERHDGSLTRALYAARNESVHRL